MCCIGRMVTFKEEGLNAVMLVPFAVKASLSRVVDATIVRVPYCVKPQGTGSIHPHLLLTLHHHHRHSSHLPAGMENPP